MQFEKVVKNIYLIIARRFYNTKFQHDLVIGMCFNSNIVTCVFNAYGSVLEKALTT